MSRKLFVYLYEKPVGILFEDSLGHLLFQYDSDANNPLSVRLPIRSELYDRFYAEPFFDNLTPEGNALEIITDKFHISKDNPFSILDKIGGDCAGAVSLYKDKLPPNTSEVVNEIDENVLAKIIRQLPKNPLLTGIDNAPRLSLAGAQSKFAVFKDVDGKYYCSNNPTTHIIKIANIRFPHLLENELFCMKLAGTINVNLRIAKRQKYLEIERYDRKKTSLNTVERIHQEDFCQTLGYLAKRKYQADGGPKIRDLHKAILQYSSQKAIDSYKFIKLLTFNYLIGNTDAHAKNFSLLHANNKIILAPAYDLLSIEIYPQKTVSHEIAMTINGKGKYSAITPKDWLALYEQLGLNPTATLREIKRNYLNIIKTAKDLRNELNKKELTKSPIYDDIIALIKKRYAKLLP